MRSFFSCSAALIKFLQEDVRGQKRFSVTSTTPGLSLLPRAVLGVLEQGRVLVPGTGLRTEVDGAQGRGMGPGCSVDHKIDCSSLPPYAATSATFMADV